MIRSRVLCGALAVATLAPAAASAQRGGPYAGLFGRPPDRTGAEFTAVQFRTTTGAQIGQTLQADFDQVEAVPEGFSAGADAGITADYLRDRVQAFAHGRYAYQEYRQETAFGAPGFDAGGRVNYEVTTRLSLQGGAIHDNEAQTLTGGYGLVAVGGTQLSANGTVVENNSYGVVIDGDLGTTAHLTGLQVLSNQERGVWAQKLVGTVSAPALTVDGPTLIDQNNLTGFGALQSRGIIIIGGKISGTQKKPIVTDLGSTEEVGDGFGLFAGTGDVKLDGVTLENNQRSQGLVDQGEAGIIIIGGKVTATGDQHKVVVQHTTETVDVPAADLSTEVELPVSAPEVAIGQVVQ